MHVINAKILIAGTIAPDVYDLANDEYIEIIDIMKKRGVSSFKHNINSRRSHRNNNCKH